MSSNTQNTIQNGAIASGSDTDSIASLSSRTANLNFGGSSSPAPASSEASDEEGDITIMKAFGPPPEGPNEDGQIPFLDKSGEVSLPAKRVLLPFCRYNLTCKYTSCML